MIVLDATVLIAYLDGGDAHHDRAVTVLQREIDEDFGASPLTIAEVLVGPARAGRLDDAVAALRDLEVVEQALPPDTSTRLAELRAMTGLRMPDCCVVLAAQTAGASIAAFDDRLVKAVERLGLEAITA